MKGSYRYHHKTRDSERGVISILYNYQEDSLGTLSRDSLCFSWLFSWNFRQDNSAMVVISNDSNVVSWVSSQCDGDLVYLGVTMRYYGSDAVYDCN